MVVRQPLSRQEEKQRALLGYDPTSAPTNGEGWNHTSPTEQTLLADLTRQVGERDAIWADYQRAEAAARQAQNRAGRLWEDFREADTKAARTRRAFEALIDGAPVRVVET